MARAQQTKSQPQASIVRLHLTIEGAVQGVGFRPFVHHLAVEMGLHGWVSNSPSGVSVELEGGRLTLEHFLSRLQAEKPAACILQRIEPSWSKPIGHAGFTIRESENSEAKRAWVLPDLATCSDCLDEIFQVENRRFGYPFTNCTHCGPRFTIILGLPYDRVRTTMKDFVMCPACQAEYDNPQDRRFHAQPNACPACGPHLEVWDRTGKRLQDGLEPLDAAANALREGAIVAVKGLGGFHLMTAAHQTESVARLRQLKQREEKPFALMFPTLTSVAAECDLSDLEQQWLRSPQAPIVLLRRHSKTAQSTSKISALVAPGNPYLGVMLPSMPLHHLLMARLGFPVIATSGNLAEEPICIDEHEAVARLGGIADLFLVHNRPIVRHADDSILRVMAGREMLLRRARGFAPLPILIPAANTALSDPGLGPQSILAVGGHLKNTVALATGPHVFLSQHIGDLETPRAFAAFERVIEDLQSFYDVQAERVAADAHPDYRSTRFAEQTGRPLIRVQHHYAHVLACMAENGLTGDVLGISWDGTGYGLDGTIWGGEFLVVTQDSFQRVGHLRTFQLPGGEQAVKEPRRSALGLLYELFGNSTFSMHENASVRAFSPAELRILEPMLTRRLHTSVTSSAGRLFDGVAALLGVRTRASYEGQAAMDLEFALDEARTEEPYPVPLPLSEEVRILDWGPMLLGILEDIGKKLPVGRISRKFHHSLIAAIVGMAECVGKEHVVLSGGCFQNKYLTEGALAGLQAAGFRAYTHRWVPPNDGGIALGQVIAARRASISHS